MAYNLKYYMNFIDNASGLPVVVNIYFPEFDGEPLLLINADSPCVVSELNSSEDIFSSIRAKEYRIKFITDNLVYPGIDDFATNSDNDWKVEIIINGNLWLTGFILTDQISESWYTDNTNHVIELVATDNLGTLKKLALKKMDGTSFVPTSKQFLIDIIKPALYQAMQNLPINIFDNLFAVGFIDRNDATVITTSALFLGATAVTRQLTFLLSSSNFGVGDFFTLTGTANNDSYYTVESVSSDPVFSYLTVLEAVVDEAGGASVNLVISHFNKRSDSYQQCKVDMRTFTVNYDTFEDAYTVLTKILESRNSVLFQHMGEWYIVRVCELFAKDNIEGTRYLPGGTVTAIPAKGWAADLNENGDIVPVDQFMIKNFLNPVLSNKVAYNYRNFDELFCNELWKRGAIELDTPTLKEYHVDCWEHYQGAIISTTPSSVLFRRREVIAPSTDVVTDNYIFLERESGSGGESFVSSETVQVSKDDKLSISFSRRLKNNYTGAGNEILARVLLYASDGSHYTLDDDGLWYLSNTSFTVNTKFLKYNFISGDGRDKWVEKTVESDYMPKTGVIRILMYEGSASAFSGQQTWFKDLKVSYKSYVDGKTFVNVEGDYNKLTLAASLKDTAEYEVFLSDSPKYNFKGALFLADGTTLTTLWYELGNPGVQYPIKRFNAIDRYRMSQRNMVKAEGSFYKWVKGEPINSVQKITISNGDANKRFMPAFIRDLNTSAGRFSALLIEVYDERKYSSTVDAAHEFNYVFKAK